MKIARKATIAVALILSVAVSFLAGCRQSLGGDSSQQLTDVVASVLTTPYSFEGRQVTIVGYYRGWDLLGETKTGPPVTRSDWVIKDDTGAIYISALSEARVSGLSPSSLEDVDTILKLIGIVHVTKEGQPYLEATSIEPIP